MGKVFVFLESQNEQGSLKKGTLELLSAAKSAGQEIAVGALGPHAKKLIKESTQFGATRAWACESLTSYNSESYVNVLETMLKQAAAPVVLASASAMTRDLFPRVAAKMDSGLANDCVELQFVATGVTARRPLYAGKCTAEVEFVNSPYQFVLMRPNQLPVSPAGSEMALTVSDLPAPTETGKVKLKEVVKGQGTQADLTEASVIVSGGRGLQAADNFKLLEDLAKPLSATVGASRAVADAGWVPHSMQVGQTGKTVAPNLYIAVGISGAIQHLAGMSGSKVIVAINKDADAPIFQKATYGIVGDLFEVLPKLTEELKKVLNK